MKKKEPKTRIKEFLDQSAKYQNALETLLMIQDTQLSVLMQNDSYMHETQKRQQQQIDDMAKDMELHGQWIDKLGEQVY